MNTAKDWATMSRCNRRKVGSALVRDNRIVATGFNGTPKGFDNECEDKDGKTHWYTLHSESNCLMYAASKGINTEGATLYITLSPCKECCKLIIQAGVVEVVYDEEYRDPSGIEFLKRNKISVRRLI